MKGSAHRLWGAARGFTGVLKLAAPIGVLALLIAAAAPVAEAVSATTAPAGFVRANVAASSGARSATSLIATPLLNAPVYAGRVEATRTIAGGGEIRGRSTTGQAVGAVDCSRPHAVFVTSGDFAGFSFPVIAATAPWFTVDTQGFDLSSILAAGDTFEVRPLHTFNTLFGADAATVPFAAAADASGADQLLVRRAGVWRAYWFTGSQWRRTGFAGDAGNDALLPQDGIVVYRRAASALDVRFLGDAPQTDAVLNLPAAEISAVANPFPADVSIGELGLETLSGWRCAAQPEQADVVQICIRNTWRTFWHNGAGWTCSSGAAVGELIPAGSAMVVVRKASESANPFALVTRPYSL